MLKGPYFLSATLLEAILSLTVWRYAFTFYVLDLSTVLDDAIVSL